MTLLLKKSLWTILNFSRTSHQDDILWILSLDVGLLLLVGSGGYVLHFNMEKTQMSPDIIYLFIGAMCGYILGYKQKPEIIIKDEELVKDLEIARNLNRSLLADKHDLQEKLWKLKEKDKTINSPKDTQW